MNIQQIYALIPIKITKDIGSIVESVKSILQLNYNSNVYELEDFIKIWEDDGYSYENLIDENKVQVRIYMDESDDCGKYGARLFSIYFDNVPIMLVKNDGRYFDDYEAYLTNKEQLMKFFLYMKSLASEFKKEEEIQCYDETIDIENIEIVNDYNLLDYYDSHLNPKYEKDDLVWAWVKENHLKYEFSDDYKGYVLTKVKITKVDKFNPVSTYFGYQIERGWNPDKNNYVMKLYTDKKDFIGIGCDFNDDLIVGKVDEIKMPELSINNQVDENGFLTKKYKYLLEDIVKMSK